MKNFLSNVVILGCLTSCLIACGQSPKTAPNEQQGETVNSSNQNQPINAAPSAPSMSYEAIYVSEEGVGYDEIFSKSDHNLFYTSRRGTDNVLEEVVEYADSIGGFTLNSAYKFGDKYLIILSTGENGRSCAGTTYAFTYDTQSEHVIGKTAIDGCSEVVQSFAEGNKLMVKKEGETTIIYNAEIKNNQK